MIANPYPHRYMTRGGKRKDGRCKTLNCTKMVPPNKNGKKSQRHYCSTQCRYDMDIRCGTAVRYHVRERDHGVCAACGIDTEKLEKILTWADKSMYTERLKAKALVTGVPFDDYKPVYVHAFQRKSLVSSDVWNQLGFRAFDAKWEADHIVPCIERPLGEPPCGLDGFQTLCVPCHRKDTAALRQRMAKRQRCPICGRRKKKATKLTKRSCMCKVMR